MSFKIIVDSNGTTNTLRFSSRKEADLYGKNLWGRWLGCPEHPKTVESLDPVTHQWKDGLISVEKNE